MTIRQRAFGRRPRPEDERDYAAELFLGDAPPTQFQVLTDAVARSHASKAVKAWVAYVAANGLPGVTPPVPTPTPAPTPDGDVIWHDPRSVLDQADTPHCIGYGGAQWGNSDPTNDDYRNSDGDALYYECKEIDGEPGVEDGSDVRSLATALRNRGRLDAYAFVTTGATGVRQWIRTKGPVILGTVWLDGMFDPDAHGFLRRTGVVRGGHCYLAVGDLVDDDACLILNSWGDAWASHGTAKIKWADLDVLLAQQGDAMVAVEKPLP